MIPAILYPDDKFTAIERQWTTVREVELLPNGLMNDIDYYTNLPNGRGYVVAVNDNIDFSVNEIFVQDYMTLNEGELLCDFVLDHCIYIFNKKCSDVQYQIISVAKSSLIFGKNTLSKEFVESIYFKKNHIVLPVNTGNHYILVVVFLKQLDILVLEPLGHEESYKTHFIDRFQQFMKLKGLFKNPYDMKTRNHILQMDGVNCGVYVIHFFSCLVGGTNLETPVNIQQLRKTLKELLLKNSSDMTTRCLFCTRTVLSQEDVFSCKSCFSFFTSKKKRGKSNI